MMRDAGYWINTQPTLQRRSHLPYRHFMPTVSDLTPRQAWYAFQTIKRWHEHGHAERVSGLARAAILRGQLGTIQSFRFITSVEEAPNDERPV